MKRRTAITSAVLAPLCLLLAAPQVLAAPDQNYSYARIVRLSYVGGDVQVQRPEEAGWQEALLNLPIRQGYQISTRLGRAEVEFESGAVARLSEDTLLKFTELALANGGRLTQISLVRGTATFYANLSSDDRFLVSTPHFTVSIPRNARFRIDAGDDGATVSVHKGDVTVEAQGASYRVTKNRAFLFRAEGEQVTLARAPDTDAWDRWVEDRENILSASRQSASLRYARAPFSYGMSDLDFYGGWYNLPGYGYGWQPRGISIGWSPYSSGRWMYISGLWTWVSYEPWGWTPYHYGHWVFVRSSWFWVPGGFHQWQPAIVYWVHFGGNRWGWGPRAPHDRPGRTPANLPHGTVIPTGNPRGYSGVDRSFERAAPGEIGRGRVVGFEPPEGFDEGRRPRGRAATGADNVIPSTLPVTPDVPASGYSGAPRTTQPREVSAEERPDPRTRGRGGEANPAPGIVYDPRDRRYVNAPEVPGRTGAPGRSESAETPAGPPGRGYSGAPGRSESAETPAGPPGRGYSGTPATPAEPRTPPAAAEIRRAERPEVQRNENRMPGRREQEQEDSPERIRPWQQPRQDAQQRQPSAPAPQAQPRYEQPRSAPAPQAQPRNDQPRPAPQPQPQPRVEPARPPSPPPAQRSEPRERQNTRPPRDP